MLFAEKILYFSSRPVFCEDVSEPQETMRRLPMLLAALILLPVTTSFAQEMPDPPNLLRPEDNGEAYMDGLLKWSSSDRATSYRLQVAEDSSDFQQIVIDSTIADTEYSFSLEAGFYQWRVSAVNDAGKSSWSEVYHFEAVFPVGVEELQGSPKSPQLRLYPNPVQDHATIRITVERPGTYKVAVYDVLGRRVETLADERFAAGQHRLRFEGKDLPSGVYVIRAAVRTA